MIAAMGLATPVMAADTVAAATTLTATDVAAAPVDVAQANPFSDVPENSWAYDAVRQLAAAGLVTGYPDNTFKGNRPMTRYEMAVLINRAVNAIQSKIAQAGAGGVKQSDLDAIKRLIDAFRPELAQVQAALRALQAQTAALKTQGDATKAEADAVKASENQLSQQLTTDEAVLRATAATVTGGAFHPKTFNRDMTYNQSAAPGAAAPGFTFGAANGAGVIANPTSLTYGTYGAQQALQTAQLGHATEFYDFRLDAGGAPDPRIQWGVRLETKARWSGSTQSNDVYSEEGTSFASTVNGLPAGIQNFGGNGNDTLTQSAVPVVNQGWVGYYSPGGFFTRLGRISQDEGQNTNGVMLGGGQVDGIQIGFKNADWYGYIFPNQGGNAAFNNLQGSTAVSATTGLAAGSPGINQCPYGFPGNPAGAGAAVAGNYGNAAAGPTGISTGPGVNGNQCITQGTTDIAGMLEYTIHKTRTAVGVTFDVTDGAPYIGWNPYAGLCVGANKSVAGAGTTSTPGAGTPTWNTAQVGVNGYCVNGQPLVYAAGTANAGSPVTGAYQTIQTNINDYGAYIAQYIGNGALPQFKVVFEALGRFGKDPFTAAQPGATGTSSWQDNKTYYLQLAFASKGNLNPGPLYPASGLRNSNVLEADFYSQGLNAGDTDGGETGTGAWESSNQYPGNYAGMKYMDLFADHWFTNNFRAGLTYFTILNRYNIPAGSSTCPGCTVGGFGLHALGVDVYLSM
jgi:hypothetical protein